MFPYSNEKEYTKHRFYESIDRVNIGAFPMLPGNYELIKNHIYNIINESSIETKDRLIINDINNIYDEYSKFKHKDVMVVNVKKY